MARAGAMGKMIKLAHPEHTIPIPRAPDQAVKAQVEFTGWVENLQQVEDMLQIELVMMSCATQVVSQARV
jgi:hypothetical protein